MYKDNRVVTPENGSLGINVSTFLGSLLFTSLPKHHTFGLQYMLLAFKA